MRNRTTSLTIIVALLALVGAPMLGFSEVFASDPFLAQITMFGGNFAPRSWAMCDGQLLAISQNTALFSLLGTTYGGDGRTTFGLPDMRGRVPMHPGSGPGLTPRKLGQKFGVESVTLTAAQMPAHNHNVQASKGAGNATSPAGNLLASAPENKQYLSGGSPNVTMGGDGTTATGGGQPHTNMQPSLCVNFIIALQGVYPSRN